jgi:prevent-host-death family protein
MDKATVTATELSRNLQRVAERLNATGEPITVIKNSKPLFRVMPIVSEVDEGLQEWTARKQAPFSIKPQTSDELFDSLGI